MVHDVAERSDAGVFFVKLVILSIVVLLFGLMAVPYYRAVSVDVEAREFAGEIAKLRTAVERHYADTGRLAREYSGKDFEGPSYHELSMRQDDVKNWRGPYLPKPLTAKLNPFGGFVYLYENLSGGAAAPGGFRPDGLGGHVAEGAGQFVAFSQVPEQIAKAVDELIDTGIPGEWRQNGRVEYDASSNGGTLMVLLLQ